jgi:hypothetical protein
MLAGNGHAVLVNVGKVSHGMPFTARSRKTVHSNFSLNFVLTVRESLLCFGYLGGLYRSLSPCFYLIKQLYCMYLRLSVFVGANRAFGLLIFISLGLSFSV